MPGTINEDNSIGIDHRVWAYAAPVAGSYFFYIPMWSILPGIYARYFGLSLTSIASVVLTVRLFDGISDLTVGYWSDKARARGGSRKPWVIVGGMASIAACYALFTPPYPATARYYLISSLAYFLRFAIGEIPHLTWGGELTLDYRVRAQVFAARNWMSKLGIAGFYAVPLLPVFDSRAYTPEVLRCALIIGSIGMTAALIWAWRAAPPGEAKVATREDSIGLLLKSIVWNRPLVLYFSAIACGAVSIGMWYGLLYIYLESYLHIGEHIAVVLLLGTVISTLTTPYWVTLISRWSKSTTWAIGVGCFLVQMLFAFCMNPSFPWWAAFVPVLLANLYFTANDVACLSIMADVTDYGTLKFGIDRGATYFAILNLVFKIGLGLGGGLALGIAGRFGFSVADSAHSAASTWGLKLGFCVLPACFAILCLCLALLSPITPHRHQIIRQRLSGRLPCAPLE